MKNGFKRVLALVLILATVLSTSGCFSYFDDPWDSIYNDDDYYYDNPWGDIGGDDYYEDDYSYYDSSDSVSSSYYPFYSSTESKHQSTSSAMSGYRPGYSNVSSQYVPSYSQATSSNTSSYSAPTSSYSTSSAVSSKVEEPEYPKVYNLVQLRDLLKKNLDNNNLVVKFEYLGSDSLNANLIARMVCTCYVSYTRQGKKYTFTITKYPGDRIVDAYFSGNKSKLNNDEIKAMNKAIEIVNKAKSSTSDSIDLEVYLHDYICKTVTYDDYTRDIEDPMNPPRNLSVVGGLLDGKANCQGYTDTFYVLASIAGFKVDRMYIKTSNDLHVTNTIYLGGQWLIVDTTFDDLEVYGSDSMDYRLFNASEDVVKEYSWPEHYEMHPIASKTTNYFYYRYYDCYYRDAAEMCADFARKYNSSPIELHGMTESGETIDEVQAAFKNAFINAMGYYPAYRFYYKYNGNTYYYQFIIS